MKPSRPTVMVAAADTADHAATDHLVHLVELLNDRGYTVRVALIRDGGQARRLRRLAHVIVADHFRSRRLGGVLTLLGRKRAAMGYRARQGRRLMRWAAAHPWIVCDPEAAWFLRVAEARPPLVIVDLADADTNLVSVPPIDRPALVDADLWLTGTDRQADDLRAAGVAAPVHNIGALRAPRTADPLPPSAGTADPVVVSTPSGTWEAISHAVEFVAQFTRRVPNLPLIWLTDPGEDEWLARHDLAHLPADVAERVTVRRRDAQSPLRPRLIVRAGYAATDPDLVLAAAFERIPTIGFEVGDLPVEASPPLVPFDVEGLVVRAIELLDGPLREQAGATQADAVRSHLDPHFRLEPLYDLLDRSAPSTRASGAAAQPAARP